ncbi:MAG TPA: hypothetical protein ENH06_00780 [bacterium]|nr:hypothetical protein [bacterium]
MINFDTITKKNNKRVLLYSGGMDSFIISKLAHWDVLLFIDSNSRYSAIEREFLLRQKLNNLVIDVRLNLSDLEMESAMVPLRNLYFVMMGSYYGDTICLGSTLGDRSTDKDHDFANLSSSLLSHIYKKSWWCEGRKIFIDLTWKKFTKGDLIYKYLDLEFPLEDLITKSFSCYYPINGRACGKCKPCIRKWISLLPYKDTKDMFVEDPRKHFTIDLIEGLKKNQGTIFSRGKEDQEVIEIYEQFIR